MQTNVFLSYDNCIEFKSMYVLISFSIFIIPSLSVLVLMFLFNFLSLSWTIFKLSVKVFFESSSITSTFNFLIYHWDILFNTWITIDTTLVNYYISAYHFTTWKLILFNWFLFYNFSFSSSSLSLSSFSLSFSPLSLSSLTLPPSCWFLAFFKIMHLKQFKTFFLGGINSFEHVLHYISIYYIYKSINI